MTTFCKTDVPQPITDALEAIKDNDEAVKAYGIQLGAEMCRQLLDAGNSRGLTTLLWAWSLPLMPTSHLLCQVPEQLELLSIDS